MISPSNSKGGTARTFRIRNTEKGPVVWEAHAVGFDIEHKRLATDVCWLIIAHNVLDGQVKHFLSNASKDTPVEVLLRVAFGGEPHMKREVSSYI